MTIVNYTSDGLCPELIVLFRAVSYSKQITIDELIDSCLPPIDRAIDDERKRKEKEILARLRGALSRWTQLGLFVENEGKVQLNGRFSINRGETIDMLTERLPSLCCHLILQEEYCTPLWGEGGLTSDFVRGISWLLAQNIYQFPTTWSEVQPIQDEQTTTGKNLSQNDVRWNGLRFWARYLGFATGDGGAFQIDPTAAVREELPSIFRSNKELPATDFLLALSSRLPVLDFGNYRKEVESSLNEANWHKPSEGHLSMSLSLALRRLDLNKTIKLVGRADTESSYRLTGRNYRTWLGFETVAWQGGKT
jgi:hypothetical protein